MKAMLSIMVVGLAIFAVGCGGQADITIVNQSTRYVSGDVDGQLWGLPLGSETTRRVDVGSTFSRSSDVEVNSDIHETWESDSRIQYRLRDIVRMERDNVYTYEVIFHATGKPAELRLLSIAPRSSMPL